METEVAEQLPLEAGLSRYRYVRKMWVIYIIGSEKNPLGAKTPRRTWLSRAQVRPG